MSQATITCATPFMSTERARRVCSRPTTVTKDIDQKKFIRQKVKKWGQVLRNMALNGHALDSSENDLGS